MRLSMSSAALLTALLAPGAVAFGAVTHGCPNPSFISQVRSSSTCSSSRGASSPTSSWHRQRARGGLSLPPSLLGRVASISSAAFAKKRQGNDDGEEDEDDTREGMSDAFRSLDALSSLDLDDAETVEPPTTDKKHPPPLPTADVLSSELDGAPEEEIEIYKEMYKEVESEGTEGMYAAIREEMGGGSAGGAPAQSVEEALSREGAILDDADGIGTVQSEEEGEGEEQLTIDTVLSEAAAGGGGGGIVGEPDMEKFMEDAMTEALEEAKAQSPGIVPENIRDDEELMKEINDIFDKANEKLIESVKEMELEQNTYAQKGADERADFVKESEARLAEAEKGVSRLMAKVAKETAEVEGAMEELKAAQTQMDANPLSKIASLKDGGIVKQGAFVGMVLFSIRSLTEVVMLAGPDGASHTTAAAIQAVVALACAVAYSVM